MNPASNHELTGKIVTFLRNIGLEVRAGSVENGTVLPGIRVDAGVLVYDPARLQFPGDLLHEAGHPRRETAGRPETGRGTTWGRIRRKR